MATRSVSPTAQNLLTLVNENVVTNRRLGFESSIELPSLRRRAYMIVNEIGTLTVTDETKEESATEVR